jgi:hypothetical protein
MPDPGPGSAGDTDKTRPELHVQGPRLGSKKRPDLRIYAIMETGWAL